MGVSLAITRDSIPFKWDETKQCAFEAVKHYIHAYQDHQRVPLSYGTNSLCIWFMTDACFNGIAAIVAQEDKWQESKIAAFFSAKMNLAQQNYPVHEQEMLAGVEGMLRYQDIMQGTKFTWLTDHKELIHLYNQKNLSGQQAR